jgi:putative lipase involved disintegration of autophagic bodies
MKDAVTYIELLASAFLYEIAATFHPLFDTYGQTSTYAYKFALNVAIYAFPHFYFVNKYVESITEYINNDSPQDHAVIVGHSLGGSIAKLVGLRTGIAAISVSSAGVSGVAAVIGGRQDIALATSFIDVLPSQDILSGFDSTGAAVYRVPCNTGIADCHNISRTLCMADYICHRKFSPYCMEAFSHKQRRNIEVFWSADSE